MKSLVILAAAAILCTLPAPTSAQSAPVLRIAITSSLQSSGLAERLIPAFENETGYQIKTFVVGSGTALRMARTGDVDATITHAQADEKAFIGEGFATTSRHVMSNDFLLVGSSVDTAGAAGSDVVAAMKRIAHSKQTFLSRGDDSGTHKLELGLWKMAALDPLGQSWYEETGQGMGPTLALAGQRKAYTLVDRGTWLAGGQATGLRALVMGDERLVNRYVAIAASAKASGRIDQRGARQFVDWLGSKAAQTLIADYRIDGKPLFDLPGRGAAAK